MKRIIFYIFSLMILYLGILSTTASSFPNPDPNKLNMHIKNPKLFFEEIKEKLQQHQTQTIPRNRIVARGKGFVIRASDFVEYKANVKTMLQSAGKPFDMRNGDLLRNMIQRELLVVYAKEKGIQVTDEEVRRYMHEQRAVWDQSPEAKRFKDEFIRAKGFASEDAYWNNPDTLLTYKKHLLIEKLVGHLYETGELNENKTFEDLERELYERERGSIHIDSEILSQL